MEEALPSVEDSSIEYVGRWNRLVSTTNWEKGRIIAEWRQALSDAEASGTACSDEAWSQHVGGVTPQHVGRLRRVWERFGDSYPQYSGLYWSHFQVAVEWADAEMWLEGAVQSGWSVARMCDQRWEALGLPPDSQPQTADVVASETDEDHVAIGHAASATVADSADEVHDYSDASADDDEDAIPFDADETGPDDAMDSVGPTAAEPTRPFAALPAMPSDLNEAFELFKLAILNHKVSGWREIARDDVLGVLDALRQLATAPTA
jgi:hypothetical protein